MDIVVLAGRIVLALFFLSSGVRHFQNTAGMVAFARSKGLPFAYAAVLISGVVLVVGAVFVGFGIWADLGALALAAFLLLAALTMHDFWSVEDAMERQNEQIHFLKNIGLAGATLMLFAFFAQADGLGLTVTGPLF